MIGSSAGSIDPMKFPPTEIALLMAAVVIGFAAFAGIYPSFTGALFLFIVFNSCRVCIAE